MAIASCDGCLKPFQGYAEALIRIKACGHLYHEACFTKGMLKTSQIGQKLTKKKAEESTCPCAQLAKINKSVEKIAFNMPVAPIPAGPIPAAPKALEPKPPLPLPPIPENAKPADPQKEGIPAAHVSPTAKGFKYASYLAVAAMVVMISAVIHTSFISMGIGCLVSIPLAYFVGKKVEQYILTHTTVQKKPI